jgi:hypothetical protein
MMMAMSVMLVKSCCLFVVTYIYASVSTSYALIMPSAKDTYLAAFWAALSKEKAGIILNRARALPSVNTQASLYTRQARKTLKLDDIFSQNPALDNTVLVVTNIDLHWIAALGSAWDIAPAFFAAHASNPTGNSIWQTVFGTSALERKQTTIQDVVPTLQKPCLWDNAHYWNVDGVLALSRQELQGEVDVYDQNFLPRVRENSNEYGFYTSTRISCWSSSTKLGSFC